MLTGRNHDWVRTGVIQELAMGFVEQVDVPNGRLFDSLEAMGVRDFSHTDDPAPREPRRLRAIQ
jgi:hypothetical protein